MQNTKIEYSSSDRTPVVLPEMEQLLPPLSAEQFSALERDISENGCYAPVIVNEDMVIVDGHNRFRICEKYGLPAFFWHSWGFTETPKNHTIQKRLGWFGGLFPVRRLGFCPFQLNQATAWDGPAGAGGPRR